MSAVVTRIVVSLGPVCMGCYWLITGDASLGAFIVLILVAQKGSGP